MTFVTTIVSYHDIRCMTPLTTTRHSGAFNASWQVGTAVLSSWAFLYNCLIIDMQFKRVS